MSKRIPEVTLRKIEPLMPRLAYEYRQAAEPETVKRVEKEIGATYVMQVDPSGRAWSLGLDPVEQSGLSNLTRGLGWDAGEVEPEPQKFMSNAERNKLFHGQ